MKITIKNFTQKYKNFVAVNNVSLNIESNKIFALLGVNGAGKTTMIKVLTGQIAKTSGEICFDKLNLDKDLNNIKKISNISPQETALATNLTVKENLMFFAKIYGLKKEEINVKVNELIEMFNLESEQNKKISTLSGGMARRVSIAISLVSNPKILYLDEPTLGLDVLSRQTLWDIIQNLKEKMTIVLTTHYMEEAEFLANKIAIMNKGKIVDVGTLNELVEKTNTKNLEQAFIKIIKESEK